MRCGSGRPNGNASRTNFKLQGEYLRSERSGTLIYDPSGADRAGDLRAAQSGWYVQGVYQFMPRWRVGLRTERLDSGTPDYGLNACARRPAAIKPTQEHAMLDFNPSEFSRVRLQFARDRRARRRHRQPVLPAVPDEPGRARRARLSERRRLMMKRIVLSWSCWPRRCRCSRPARRTPRCACSPASPNGARWRRSSAAPLVEVSVATTALQDPHQIQARPSLIARARNADLRGLHRRRARDRLAAAAAAAVGQRQGAAGAARPLRGRRRRAQARGADAARPRRRATCMPPATRTSRPTRATSRWWPRRSARGCSSSIPRNAAALRAARRPTFSSAGSRRCSAGARRRRRSRASRSSSQHKAFVYLYDWLGLKEVAVLEPKPGVEPTASHLQHGAGGAEGDAGAHGALRRLPGSAAVRMAAAERRRAGGQAALHGRRQRRREGPVRPVRRHPRRGCSPPRASHELERARLGHPRPGVRSPGCWCWPRMCRWACRCSTAASSSSTWRSRRSRGSA